MKVAIYGAGGVGAYFGARLAQAGADVHLIARGEHLRALQRDGLRLESIHGDAELDLPATDDPSTIGECDYVLFCVKSFDTESAADAARPLVGDDTAVISLQNGLDNEPALAEILGREHVMGGVAYILSTIAEPGVVEHTGGPASIIFGELDNERSERAERFLEWCERADVDATLSTDIQADLWEKAAFICALSGLTAAVRLPLGDIRETPETWSFFQDVIEEVETVASAADIDVRDDLVDHWLSFAQELGADSYSSLHYDMTHGKPMELEALHGAIRRRADDHNVDIPATDALYAILKPWARRNAEKPSETGA